MEIKTLEIAGFMPSIKGMRNPKNSWHLNDSYNTNSGFILGSNDKKLAQTLIKAGAEHRKFLRQIHVWADIDEPRYWWSEADTYSYNTKNSTSTMHKLLTKDNPITKELFIYCEEDEDVVMVVVERLELIRELWMRATARRDSNSQNHCLVRAKRLLLEGFMQLRTMDTNYEEIRNMYHQRKHHRLKEEWVDTFCKWVESLPYFEEFIAYTGDEVEF